MTTFSLFAASALCVATFALGGSASAVSIGVNFSTGAGSNYPLAASDLAGVVPQANYNNLTGNNGSGTALVNDSGVATSLNLTFSSPNNYSSGNGGGTGNQQLLIGYIDTNQSATATVSLTNIPFSLYDIYVYVGSDQNNRTGTINVGAETFYFKTTTGGSFDGTLTQSTATTQAGAINAEYVRFTNLSGATQTITGTRVDNNIGIHGFQVVQVPEPTSVALLAIGAVGLGLRRRR